MGRGEARELLEVIERYPEAVLLCDDAHGTGTLGKRGTGIVEKYDLHGRVPIVISTFSKTFGGIGGILLGMTRSSITSSTTLVRSSSVPRCRFRS